MKKFLSVLVLLFIGAVMVVAQHSGTDIDTGKTIWEIIYQIAAPVVAAILLVWKVFDVSKWSKPMGKLAEYTEKGADFIEGFGTMLQSAGFERPGMIVKEGSKPLDELGDVFQSIADATADGTFDKEELQKSLNEGKEVYVAGKNFKIVIKKTE